MKRMFLGLIWLLMALTLPGTLCAKTVFFPDQKHAAYSVTIPNDWNPEVEKDECISAQSPDELVFFIAWMLEDEETLDELSAGLDEMIPELVRNPKFDKPVEKTINGMEALELKGRGKEKESGTRLELEALFLSLVPGQVVLVFSARATGAPREAVSALHGIVQSITPAGGKPAAKPPSREDPSEEEAKGKTADEGKDASAALKPGEWAPILELGNVLYPSAVIALTTLNLDAEPDPDTFGDSLGMFGVVIKALKDNARVEVEIASSKSILPSKLEASLSKAGEVYYLYPTLKYNYDNLLSIRQTYPEDLTFKVALDGKPTQEQIQRIQVRPINECVYGFVDPSDGEPVDLSWMFAAYVNENHPFIDEVLGEALDAGTVKSFAGYQGNEKAVKKEMKAVWTALQERGFRYSNIATTSGESEEVFTQHVRLPGDAVKTSQANCVDGSVLMASIFRKLGMDVFLVVIPGHMFLGVNLDEAGEHMICIETTMLGEATFEEAVKAGNEEYAENEDAFADADDLDHQVISIKNARAMGIMPLKDP